MTKNEYRTNYYPFGMLMPGRSNMTGNQYRYGFNGKENDTEVKGEGNQQDYGKRIYDPRLGRFLSIDPLTTSFPMLTPFQFASNRPIQGIDLDGEEVLLVTGSANILIGAFGEELYAGIGIGQEGIGLLAGSTLHLGLGAEVGAGVNFTFFPYMNSFKSLDDSHSSSYGISGAFLGKFGLGYEKSDGYKGGTISYGVGLGAKIVSGTPLVSLMKVIKWDDIGNFIKSNTDEAKLVAGLLNISGSKTENTVEIIKDYYKKAVADIKNSRIQTLQNENNKNRQLIKESVEYLNDFKNSNWAYQLVNIFIAKQVEAEKREAEEKIDTNNNEIQNLEKIEEN